MGILNKIKSKVSQGANYIGEKSADTIEYTGRKAEAGARYVADKGEGYIERKVNDYKERRDIERDYKHEHRREYIEAKLEAERVGRIERIQAEAYKRARSGSGGLGGLGGSLVGMGSNVNRNLARQSRTSHPLHSYHGNPLQQSQALTSFLGSGKQKSPFKSTYSNPMSNLNSALGLGKKQVHRKRRRKR
jgi:hypothetical protein